MKKLSILVVLGILIMSSFVLAKPDLIVDKLDVTKEVVEKDVRDDPVLLKEYPEGFIRWTQLNLKIKIKNIGDETIWDDFGILITDNIMNEKEATFNQVELVQIKFDRLETGLFLGHPFINWVCRFFDICPVKIGDGYARPLYPGSSREIKTTASYNENIRKIIISVDDDISERPKIEGLIRPNYNNVIDESNEENNEFWYGI